MLPSVVSREVMEAVRQQLRAQFPSTTSGFLTIDDAGQHEAAIEELLKRDGGIFKGPYLSFGLPFRKMADDQTLPFRHVRIDYTPYTHQMKAFQRLTGHAPQPTLVATGTGSGKTECFMYPLLEHCAATTAPGIKALVIYPMNALAQDQARRFAEEVHNQEGLRGKVTVGLYTGDSSRGRTVMSADSVIADRDTLQRNPPDILLTNYKMLDFLLIRPKDRELWRHNEAGMLRYLVVDELHTFDGAQGTDLACLVRRLKDRLDSSDDLACVGTSATVGDDIVALTNYASNVFDTRFGEDSVLREERLSSEQFLPDASDKPWPDKEDVIAFASSEHRDQQEYLANAYALWLAATGEKSPAIDLDLGASRGGPLGQDLATELSTLAPFQELLRQAEGIKDKHMLVTQWQQRWKVDAPVALAAVDSLIALASTAREPGTQGKRPFVTVREQLWLRELRRMVATVSQHPQLCFRDDLIDDRVDNDSEDDTGAITLPVIHCNNCHATGWISQSRPTRPALIRDVRVIYDSFFGKNPDTVAIYPATNIPSVRKHRQRRLCSHCGALNALGEAADNTACKNCESDASKLVSVVLPDMNRAATEEGASAPKFQNACPYCDTHESLFILGSRAATLSSVAVNRLFNSRFNDHAKLIAFSDSVQDAAHRAGFFAARTYRDVVRSALGIAAASGQFENLAALIEGFGPWWRRRFEDSGQSEADFVANFLAPDLAWLNDWDELQQSDRLPAKSDLVERWVLPRLSWEALVGFGLQARSGRTLERTHTAAVLINPVQINVMVNMALTELQEQIAELRGLDAKTLRRFLLGFFWTLRTRGALFEPVLTRYLQSVGNPYELRNNRLNPYLPRVGLRSTLPVFLSLRQFSGKNGKRFDAVTTSKGASWYVQWFNKVLADDNVMASASVEAAYAIVLRAGVKAGLLESHDVRDQQIWSLVADQWLVSTVVATLVCSDCQHRIQVPRKVIEDWEDLPCMRSHCQGKHYPDSVGKVVASSDRILDGTIVEPEFSTTRHAEAEYTASETQQTPVRLVAAEHTAVLDSDSRAQIERSFKRNPSERWDINLLSATPTMEMGVDIGDLSSVLLCSVPPAQANYLQRIGRAGRKDGNAFNLTIATGAPHDLYFYSDPHEMMEGSVQPPGVFLEAIAVLERQLLAYCLDRWVQSGIADDAIPNTLREVLDSVDNGADRQFPQTFLNYIDTERNVILRDFQHLFRSLASTQRKANHLATDSSSMGGLFKGLGSTGMNQLNEFLQGKFNQSGTRPSITVRLVNLFEDKASQRKRFRRDIDQLKRDIERLEKQPEDESRNANLAELSAERKAIQRLVRTINRQQTLNFLTDEGVLPNYAFPEEGVKLNSVIFRKRERAQSTDDGKTYDKIELDIRRPAQVALRELAPHSRFYGNSRQVQIDQVMVSRDDVELWRFCASCNHGMSVNMVDEYNSCPRCGHTDWHSSEQKMTLLKLREVYANASDRDSRIGDDSDDREPVFFNRQFLFDLDPGAIERTWRIEEPTCPFGFEFLSKATFREINFGRAEDSGSEIEIAGNKSRRAGFPVCKHCGKVRMWRKRIEDNHTRRCKMYGKDEEEQKREENLWNALYLYRELQSEAIRILLPLADLAQSEKRLQSFIAALHLGLKKRYRGNVDHLQIRYVSEPVSGTQLRRHFLVLLDSVPGGTGYLAELSAHPDAFKAMLLEAKSTLEHCQCQEDPQSDGCYRCLFAYRQSHDMELTSRQAALDTLSQILEHWDQLAALESGDTLNHTEVNRLYDSELERRFVDVLSAAPGCSMQEQRIDRKVGYLLTVRDTLAGGVADQGGDASRNSMRWSIEPQVDLNESDDVAMASRPDFLLRCLSVDETRALPIAVFMDGFEFHKDSQAADTAKRFAIMQTKRYRVWSLTWQDLPGHATAPEYLLESWFDQPYDRNVTEKLYDQIAASLSLPRYAQQHESVRRPAFEQLLQYLRDPVGVTDAYREWAVSRVFGLTNMAASSDQQPVLQQVGAWLPELWQEKHLSGDGLLGRCELSSEPVVTAVAAIPSAALDALTQVKNKATENSGANTSVTTAHKSILPEDLPLSLCLLLDDREVVHEGYRDSWQLFWSAANLLQFLPHFLPASRSGIEAVAYAPVLEIDNSQEDESLGEGWEQAVEQTLHSETLAAFAKSLGGYVVPPPHCGLDILDGEAVVGMLEWAWPEQKIGFADDVDDAACEKLTGFGWKLIRSVDSESLQRLLGWLT